MRLLLDIFEVRLLILVLTVCKEETVHADKQPAFFIVPKKVIPTRNILLHQKFHVMYSFLKVFSGFMPKKV
jgi:hypothetical protein